MSLSLWCLVLSDSRVFRVNVPNDADVYDIQELVKEKDQSSLRDTDALALVLWKLNEPEPVLPYETLPERIHSRGADLSKFATRLLATDKLSAQFPGPLSTVHLHLLVDSTSAVVGAQKRPSPSTMEDGPTFKRSRTVDVGESKLNTYIPYDRIRAIHDAIKEIPIDFDYSDFTKMTKLPFPSLQVPYQRFKYQETNGVSYFQYMGRSKFEVLSSHMKSHPFNAGYEKLYLFGSSGSGKSHILAAMVCRLIREGQRVVYIPDCYTLTADPGSLQNALYLAFYDEPLVLQAIQTAVDAEGLVNLWMHRNDVVVVVDQLNALESVPEARYFYKILGRMRHGRRYIFSASANEQSNKEATMKQSGTTVISFHGGMSEEETEQWFHHYSDDLPALSDKERQAVKHLTGCLPLLLQPLRGWQGEEFNLIKFQKSSELYQVATNVSSFYQRQKDYLKPNELEQYHGIMMACVRSERVKFPNAGLFDLRYFYIDQEIGRYSCGIPSRPWHCCFMKAVSTISVTVHGIMLWRNRTIPLFGVFWQSEFA